METNVFEPTTITEQPAYIGLLQVNYSSQNIKIYPNFGHQMIHDVIFFSEQ